MTGQGRFGIVTQLEPELRRWMGHLRCVSAVKHSSNCTKDMGEDAMWRKELAGSPLMCAVLQ
jgi:hypothetical protein